MERKKKKSNIKSIFNILLTNKDYENLKNAGRTLTKYLTSSHLLKIPDELFIELSIFLNYGDLFKFMRTNIEIYNILKNSKYLWKKIFYQTFGNHAEFPQKYGGPDPFNWFQATVDFLTDLEKLKFDLRFYPIILQDVPTKGNEFLIQKINEIVNDGDIVSDAVRQNGLALEYASTRLKDERGIALEAIKQNGLALEYASDNLRNSGTFVFQAVKQNGLALKYANTRLKDEREIVLKAIKQNRLALQYASNQLREYFTDYFL